MRDWLRKRLDAWDDRQNKRDEEFAALLNRSIDSLADRQTRRIYLAVLAAVNALVWLSVIIFPGEVRKAWITVTDLDDKIGSVVIAIVFGLGMWLTYTLFRLKYTDLEAPHLEEEILNTYSYSLHSVKRWRIWLVSAIGGVLNALLLIVAAMCLDWSR